MTPETPDLKAIMERLERVERQNRRMKEIWLTTSVLATMVAGVMLAVTLSAAFAASQAKKEPSPFEKYLQSSVNELAVRKIAFNVAALQERVPYQNGILVPFVEGLARDGKLIITVHVSSNQLPRTVDARKNAMLDAVGIAMAAYQSSFGREAAVWEFDKNTRVAFFDVDTLVRSTPAKPPDPVIAIYENKELTFH
jgi:hypothetical protein